MIRSFKYRREREREKKRTYIHVILLQMLPIGFFVSFLKNLSLRVNKKKKRKKCHAEVKQYCSMYSSDTK
jgi:hypothetical protein